MRVLVIEDEQKLADFIARGLRAERMAVDVALTGLDGLAKARETVYDLVVLDLMLPGLDGAGVLAKLREAGNAAPVLILTARDATQEKVKLFESGADDYLTKPFAFAELLVRLKALMRRPPLASNHLLKIGDLEIDRLTQQVRRAGVRISLTGKEYSLLEYMAAHADRVLSRTMIIEHVWDESFEALTNIVDVYVRHLRAKLDDEHERKLIHTVRGVGYCFSAQPPS